MRFFFLFLIIFTSCREINEESLLNNYAIYSIKNNLWDSARFYLERASSIYPYSSKIANNLGVVYEYLGMQEKAILSYKRAIELDKERVYYKNLACILPLKIPNGLKNELKTIKIKMEKYKEPDIDSRRIDRLALCIYAEDKNIIPYISQAIKEQMIQNTTFYILYHKEYPKNKEEIKDISLKLLCDNILLIDVSDYSISDSKDFDVSTKFIKDENRYEFLRTYWTERRANVSYSLSFFDKDGTNLFKKDFKYSLKKRYDTENPVIYDYPLFLSLFDEGIKYFLSLMKPKEFVVERWLVKD